MMPAQRGPERELLRLLGGFSAVLDHHGVLRRVLMGGDHLDAQAWLGKPWRPLLPKELWPTVEHALAQALAEGFAEIDGFSLSFQGHHHVLRLRLARLSNGAGEETELLLHAVHAGDGPMLAERLKNGQSLEAMGQLAGGVAHDFNNLLSGILGYADLLRSSMEGHEVSLRHVNSIISAARRASELTQGLLGFIRRDTVVRQVVDVHDMIRAAVGLLRRTLGPSIAIHMDLAAVATQVISSRARLESALINLGVNARDAMPTGGALEFRSRSVELPLPSAPPGLAPGRWCVVEVRDTGMGMDKATQEHCFQPFFTTKPPGQGTGLGLPAVLATVRDLGGTVTLVSAPGQGSAFTLWLPASEGRELHSTTTTTHRRKRLQAKRVLVADDEPLLRELTQDLLLDLGCEVETAQDASEAVAKFQSSPLRFDTVLIDLLMPGMSGEDGVHQLLCLDPTVRIVVMTGLGDGAHLDHLRQMGIAGVLAKPFTSRELAAVLQGH
jgi:two-component system cell cycle sensor histidine kinase/response regulator CckA